MQAKLLRSSRCCGVMSQCLEQWQATRISQPRSDIDGQQFIRDPQACSAHVFEPRSDIDGQQFIREPQSCSAQVF